MIYSQSTNMFKEEERELYANLASLQEMYPAESKARLVEALASCSNDVDQAIDWIIHRQNEGTLVNWENFMGSLFFMSLSTVVDFVLLFMFVLIQRVRGKDHLIASEVSVMKVTHKIHLYSQYTKR